MNERFTLENTLLDIVENERVSRKLPLFFDVSLCDQVKWPFNKMKLKRMSKVTHFPAQELVTAANFILERREKGEKISIPVWRDLPQEQEAVMEQVVMIPFMVSNRSVPAVLICPGMKDHHIDMLDEGMQMAAFLQKQGCQTFICHYQTEADAAVADMARAIRFLRANYQKLGIHPEKVILLAHGSACRYAIDLCKNKKDIEDVTHRYDMFKPEPDGLWIVRPTEEIEKKDRHLPVLRMSPGENSELSEQAWLQQLINEMM